MNSEVQIRQSTDDAHENNAGGIDRGSGGVYLVDNNWCGGLLFRALPLMKGASLLSSRFWVYVNSDAESSPREDWFVQAIDDPPAITDGAYNLSLRIPSSSPSVRWEETMLREGWRLSTDMSPLLNTLLGRAGWFAERNVLFVACRKGEQNNENSSFVFRSENSGGDFDPRLRITWLPPAQPIP